MKSIFLVLGTVSGLSSKGWEFPPDPAKVALPAVPAVRNAGKDGMPELPSLDDIMSPTSQTMFGIRSKAKQLEAKMLKIEHENSLRLQRQKAVFDRKLKEQEAKNQGVAKENADLAKSIMQLKQKNEGTLAKSKTLREAIALRKSEVKNMQEQLAAVQQYMVEMLQDTEESKAPELAILDQVKESERPGLSGLSFLEVDEEPEEALPDKAEGGEPENPENLLGVLADGVKNMKQQGAVTSNRLKSLFLSSLQDGVKRRKALKAQQKVLQQTMTTMKSYEARLGKAEERLTSTKQTLDKHLHDAGLFLKKLSQLLLAKPEDGQRELAALQTSHSLCSPGYRLQGSRGVKRKLGGRHTSKTESLQDLNARRRLDVERQLTRIFVPIPRPHEHLPLYCQRLNADLTVTTRQVRKNKAAKPEQILFVEIDSAHQLEMLTLCNHYSSLMRPFVQAGETEIGAILTRPAFCRMLIELAFADTHGGIMYHTAIDIFDGLAAGGSATADLAFK
ncbi:SPAC6G9.14 [Symbiodinium natans]|uniref:SPAC6G9.14 protein n=1 Tax=Symbiodinium natans TaxID=878477 RepID=A0A812QQF8_9DINO|nr:SPAC6G9.14 [Symbiodinium natans]